MDMTALDIVGCAVSAALAVYFAAFAWMLRASGRNPEAALVWLACANAAAIAVASLFISTPPISGEGAAVRAPALASLSGFFAMAQYIRLKAASALPARGAKR